LEAAQMPHNWFRKCGIYTQGSFYSAIKKNEIMLLCK
jgi:hypothetical protein